MQMVTNAQDEHVYEEGQPYWVRIQGPDVLFEIKAEWGGLTTLSATPRLGAADNLTVLLDVSDLEELRHQIGVLLHVMRR